MYTVLLYSRTLNANFVFALSNQLNSMNGKVATAATITNKKIIKKNKMNENKINIQCLISEISDTNQRRTNEQYNKPILIKM